MSAQDEMRVLLNRLHREGGHGWIVRAAERITIHWDAEQRRNRKLTEAIRPALEWIEVHGGMWSDEATRLRDALGAGEPPE
jgi:hypothetical protein